MDPLRESEVEIFDALRQQLTGAFCVFYSRPWFGIAKDGAEIDGEADFVIAHPDLGLLVLEVKGGGVEYDAKLGHWHSTDRYGFRHRIKDPVAQARRSKYELLKKLNGSPCWKTRHICARHGVVFPHVFRPDNSLAADLPLEILACRQEMQDLASWINSRFIQSAGEDDARAVSPLGSDGIAALKQLLAYSFRLSIPVGTFVAFDERCISTLTEEQLWVLDALEGNRRLCVSGGAGSGKTVLAFEKAIRAAKAGQDVLFLCFNRPLSSFLKSRLSGQEKIAVFGFHEFCGYMSQRAGIELVQDLEGKEFFESSLPMALADAIQKLPNIRFDLVIVDEAQDFHLSWWPVIEQCLRSQSESSILIFADSNQNVYQQSSCLPPWAYKDHPFHLSRNLRNTKQIHKCVGKIYKGDSYRPAGPEGRAVEWITFSQSEAHDIANRVRELTAVHGLKLKDIAVLVGNESLRRRLTSALTVAGTQVQSAGAADLGKITVDTVARFKGLESSVVILAALNVGEASDEFLYTAVTRARSLLLVYGTHAELRQLQSRFGVMSDAVLPEM